MPKISDQRPFLATKDLGRSIEFYVAMGWTVGHRDDGLARVELGGHSLYLQAYFQKEWAENTMVHFSVDDAAAWHARAEQVKAEGGFDEVRIRPPKREPYGALVTHVTDPAGVLLHFAQFD